MPSLIAAYRKITVRRRVLRALRYWLTTTTLTILVAGGLSAESVYLSATGKTYHKTQTCSVLARTAKKLTAERAAAEQHHLKPCRSCYRPAKTTARDWAKEVK
jgi:hypothetical protein